MDQPFETLFLCTGNSARSILAECLLGRLGGARFRAHSAGSQPKGAVHPQALGLLAELGYETADLRSKSWDEFAAPTAPALDLVVTVCDSAAQEACPFWPGAPLRASWPVADPAAVTGSDAEQRRAFERAYRELEARIRLLTSLPLDALDPVRLQAERDAVGKFPPQR